MDHISASQYKADAQEGRKETDNASRRNGHPLLVPLVDETLDYGEDGGDGRVHGKNYVVHLHRIQAFRMSVEVLFLK